MRHVIEQSILDSIEVKQRLLADHCQQIEAIAKEAIACFNRGGKIVLCGNGGSAADAQHLAAELVGKFLKMRRALPALALSTNTSILTAIANDIDYDAVFARQVQAQLNAQDILIGISTSGNSPNVINAVKEAKQIGARTIALSGCGGGELAQLADLVLVVPSDSTPRIQESHITVGHIVCDLIERELFKG